jgi:membrane associated rhomboid family serine protease
MLSPSPDSRPPLRQPVFNVPGVIVGLIAVLLGIHAARTLLLAPETDLELLLRFAFIPVRETNPDAVAAVIPAGGARIWSFVTYALLHGSWGHVGFNALWLAAFGSPLAWRFGVGRFLLFSAVCAAAGALLHLAIYPHEITPMIGASAAISGHMAATSRFVFASGGPMWRPANAAAYRFPAARLSEVVRDRRVVTFLLAWFGLNLIFGIGAISQGFGAGSVAWDAHVGGFLAGFLLFPLFDPVRR